VIPREEWRPSAHAGTALVALGMGVLPRWANLTGAALGILAGWVVIPRTPVEAALRRPGERWWNGVRTYPLAVAGLVVLLPETLAAAAWAVMGFGDAAASIVGRHVPSRKFFGHPKATWAGTMALVAAGAFAGWGVGSFVAATGGAPLGDPSHVLMAAAAAALVDLVPWPIDDNLPMAAAAGLTLAWSSGLLG
jgi:dolichol kinase